jgi:hypothetical protein
MALNLPSLRNAYKKLMPLVGRDHPHYPMFPQEVLDFLAMSAGAKPLCLIGQGFDDPEWRRGAIVQAKAMGLRVIEDLIWLPTSTRGKLPDWFLDYVDGAGDRHSVVYVTRSPMIEKKLVALAERGWKISMDEEADLLGYPRCCVRHHYEASARRAEVMWAMLERAGNGDRATIERLIADDTPLDNATEAEQQVMEETAANIRVAPYTSVVMCPSCAADAPSPAHRLSAEYYQLATTIDPAFADLLSYLQTAHWQ